MKQAKVIPLYSYLKPLYQYFSATFCTNVKFFWKKIQLENSKLIIPIQFQMDGELYIGELLKDQYSIYWNTKSETGKIYSVEVELAALKNAKRRI